jgi:AcrR family transcriptional regulator
VGRWDPDARGRLARTATELYLEKGFEQATVAEIAKRAGLTERTFFRYFVDKREVLFGGSAQLQELMVGAVAATPASAGPMDAVAAGVLAAAQLLKDRDYSRQRQAIIAANPILQERELIKMAALATAFAETLRQRGVREPAASLTAEASIAVFRVAFERWVADGNKKDLARLIRESFDELQVAVGGSKEH